MKGATRDEARKILLKGLSDMILIGPEINRDFLLDILSQEGFSRGKPVQIISIKFFLEVIIRLSLNLFMLFQLFCMCFNKWNYTGKDNSCAIRTLVGAAKVQ